MFLRHEVSDFYRMESAEAVFKIHVKKTSEVSLTHLTPTPAWEYISGREKQKNEGHMKNEVKKVSFMRFNYA